MEFCGATVDPGIHTAIAFWKLGKLYKMVTLNIHGLSDAELLLDLQGRLKELHSDRFYPPLRVIIEDVSLWTGSAKSMASGGRGNLTTLSKIAGAIGFFYNTHCPVEYLSPQRWKGQLKYKQLRRILNIKFNYQARNDHEASAYGMGLYIMGLFK